MPESAIPVEFLFAMKATLGASTAIQSGPQGTRAIVPVTGGTFDGPRLKGTIVAPGGDWVTLRPDGSYKLDVRATLLTDDGATILVTYNGIGIRKEGRGTLRTAPLFETGDERYAWLNNVQAVGLGFSGQGTVQYDVYALSI